MSATGMQSGQKCIHVSDSSPNVGHFGRIGGQAVCSRLVQFVFQLSNINFQ